MLLREIIGVDPLPFEWVTDEAAKFSDGQLLYGVVLEQVQITLPARSICVANVSFGTVVDHNMPISAANINRELTNNGKPWTILSTVAQACLAHPDIQTNDVIVVAASDHAKNKRIRTYDAALYELAVNMPQFKHRIAVTTATGAALIAVCKVEFTLDEQQFIAERLGIVKA